MFIYLYACNTFRFGQGKYISPQYSMATGVQECDVCKKMISAHTSALANGMEEPENICSSISPDKKEMVLLGLFKNM